MPFDIAILKFFNLALANPALDILCKYFADFDYWALPVVVTAVILLWKGKPRERYLVLLAVVTVAVIDSSVYYILKPLFTRLRPCQEDALVWLRLPDGCGGRYGFPSSHAANMFGQAMVIGSFYRFARKYIYPLAVLVSLSRVYLGVHYPTDILGGAVYGAMVGLLILLLAKLLAPEKIGRYYWAGPKRS